MAEESNQSQQMQIKVSDDVLKGAYANMVQVGHTAEEFILDFINLFPPAGVLSSRIVVAPAHMKHIVAAMQENIKQFEARFGVIKGVEAQSQPTTTSSSNHKYGFDTEQAH